MVTYINKVTSWEHPYMEYRGLSTDTKPTDAPVNAKFVELDTGVEYYFSGGTWNIAPSPSGDGSGSSQPVVVNDKLIVTLTEEDDTWTADKTIAEIVEAYEAKQVVVALYPVSGSVFVEIPCNVAAVVSSRSAATFCGNYTLESSTYNVVSIIASNTGGDDAWDVDVSQKPVGVPSYSSSNNGQVLGVRNGSPEWVDPETGITSWNDLEDKPFYEETVSVAINYTNPYIDGANADKVVEASYLNTSVPISLYRVGDALTAAQLEGATMDLIYNDGTSSRTGSITLTSANITSVQNGRYYMSEGMPYFVVADVDNTTIEIPNCCQFTSLDAGTYLEYIDMGNFFAGAYFIIPSITKDGVTVIHKLDEKFYNGGVSSWNDLTDKPFYEEVTPGINLEMPDGASYVEASFTTTGAEPMTIPMKLYRAGGVYTTEQLVGATATLDIGETNPYSKALDSESFLEIEQDGETVGYLVAGEGAYAFIVLADNTVFNTSLDVFDMTDSLTSDNIPTAGTYLINAVIGADETTCTSITKAATTKVHKLDAKFYDGGASSWNDLNDRPFYETVTAAGYNFEIDLDDPNYVSGYFDIGEDEDVPAKFYRVGDPLTAAQLLGATGTVNLGGENNSKDIKSDYIEEIEDNGDTVGLFVAGDMPYCLVINNANTTIDVDATNDRPFGCSGTFTQAGTYLFWIDLSTMEEGASAYAVSLVKEPEATITPLPDKYYKAPLIVEITGSNQTGYESNKTFNEIVAAVQAGRNIIAYIETANGYFVGYPSGFAASGLEIIGETYNNGYKLGVSIQIDSSDGVTANYYSINTNTI